MPRSFRIRSALRCAACLVVLVLVAACSAGDDSGQPQSFAAHIDGSYTAAAVTTSAR